MDIFVTIFGRVTEEFKAACLQAPKTDEDTLIALLSFATSRVERNPTGSMPTMITIAKANMPKATTVSTKVNADFVGFTDGNWFQRGRVCAPSSYRFR